MANTFGGLILIGVADDDSRPITPISGIDFDTGLQERITNIILSNIVPPVFPEIAVCRNDTGNKAVVVIRIPESDHTPHAIAQNTKVYLRTGNVTEPHELATVDRIDWLKEHRRRAVELREEILQNAADRFERVYKLCVPTWNRGDVRVAYYPGGGWLTLTACPLFPLKVLADPPVLQQHYQDIQVADTSLDGGRLPMPTHVPQTYADGCINPGALSVNVHYADLNVLGGYFYRQSLYPLWMEERAPTIYFERFLRIIDRFLASAATHYELLGYQGSVRLTLGLTCENWALMPSPAPDGRLRYLLDRKISYEDTMFVGALRERSRSYSLYLL